MADRTVKVQLTAQVQGYIEGMEKAARATRDAGKETEKLAQQQQAFEEMGRASMVAGGAVAAGLALSTKAAIDWESAWAGVTKTVDGSPEQMAALEGQLRGLASTLPATHEEIAGVAEAAGQLGIQRGNVVAFTETMINLGETTNLSADQAATSLAQMMNVMGTSQGDVDRMGATLVALGNAGASTESEIVMMAQRISGAGKLVGASEGEVLGLANALASMGISAELGGGVASRVLQDLYSAVETGGESLQGFADVAGISSQEFAQAFENDPVRALDTFAKGLNGVEASGGNVVKTLSDLGFKSSEEQRVLLQLKGAGDLLTDSLDLQAKAWEENTALQDEANKRYETTASQLDIMRNKVTDAAISFGEQLLPLVEGAAEGISGFADMLNGVSGGPMGQFIASSTLLAGGILLAGGVAMAVVPKIAAYKVALETLGVSTAGVGGKLKGLRSFLMGPWGVALAAGGIAVHQFNMAMDGSVVSAGEMAVALKQGKDALGEMQAGAANNEQGFTKVVADVSQHLNDLPALADKAAESGRGFWSSMSFNENAALDNIAALGDGLAQLSATDLPAAQEAFAEFVDEAGLNDAQALTFFNEEMGGFKSQLLDAAEAAGVATDDASLLKFALGDVGDAAGEGAEGTGEQTDALSDLEQKAADTQEAISDLADEIRGFGDASFDTREANRALEESYVALTEGLAENGLNFDIATEAGRANESALDDVAQGANEAAAAVLEQTGSQEAANAKLEEGRQKLIDILAPYYGSRDAAAAYVDQLGLISPQKTTEIVLQGAYEAMNTLTQLEAFQFAPKVLKVEEQIRRNLLYQNPGDPSVGADGFIEAYADGGFATGIYKGGSPIHKFAEPETGWEAYISGKPSARDRNRQIWVETGERLGMGVGQREVVHVPTHVTVVDADNRMVGTMRVVANSEIDQFAQQSSQTFRQNGGR